MADSISEIDISAREESAIEKDDLSTSSNHSSPSPHFSEAAKWKQNPLRCVAEKITGAPPEFRRAEEENGQKVRRTLETKNVTLVAVSLIGSAAFTTVCNLPSSFLIIPEKPEFRAIDVIAAHLPPIFYLMVFNSTVFMVCLIAILVLMWSLPLRPVVVFLTVTIGVVYAILVKNIMPKFLVRVGNGTIEGTHLVGLLALGFICIGAILYYCFSPLRVVSKTTPESKHIP